MNTNLTKQNLKHSLIVLQQTCLVLPSSYSHQHSTEQQRKVKRDIWALKQKTKTKNHVEYLKKKKKITFEFQDQPTEQSLPSNASKK